MYHEDSFLHKVIYKIILSRSIAKKHCNYFWLISVKFAAKNSNFSMSIFKAICNKFLFKTFLERFCLGVGLNNALTTLKI